MDLPNLRSLWVIGAQKFPMQCADRPVVETRSVKDNGSGGAVSETFVAGRSQRRLIELDLAFASARADRATFSRCAAGRPTVSNERSVSARGLPGNSLSPTRSETQDADARMSAVALARCVASHRTYWRSVLVQDLENYVLYF